MVRRKRLREFHIPKYLGIKAREWRKLRANGSAPPPDGHTFTDRQIATGKGLIPDYFWYEETLDAWLARHGRSRSHDV
jgi:hypothetical protein